MNYPQTLTVEVTAADIKGGFREQCRSCPIALAASRVGNRPSVGRLWVHFGDSPNFIRYNLPDVARAFVDAFDAAVPVKPFTFTMERDE